MKENNYNYIKYIFLLFIRSANTYNFVSVQKVLPLPCTRSIRRYLSFTKTGFGFDSNFFILLKNKCSIMNEQEKHGILVFDEFSIRESIKVNTNSLTYFRLEDFGGDADIQHYGEKANYSLVFLFQSLCCNFSQPIAVFVFKGNVKGYYFKFIQYR